VASDIKREEHRLRVFESTVLRIFGQEGDGVMKEWRKLHNEEFHYMYPSPSIIRNQVKEVQMGGACSTNGEKRKAYKLFLGKQEEKRPLGGQICSCVDNIKIDLGDIGWGGVDWIGLA
jgi:hypothetical protein